MGLREQLMDDLKEAMREKDETRKRAIRSVLAALPYAEIELDASGNRVSLDEDGLLRLIDKQARERQESIDAFQSGGRDDLVVQEEADLAVLLGYLPRQLDREEIEAEARKVLAEVGASGPQDMGKVMKPLLADLRRYADRRLANQIVQGLLIEVVAQRAVAEVSASGPQDMDKVMILLLARLRKRAYRRLAKQIVRELLAG